MKNVSFDGILFRLRIFSRNATANFHIVGQFDRHWVVFSRFLLGLAIAQVCLNGFAHLTFPTPSSGREFGSGIGGREKFPNHFMLWNSRTIFPDPRFPTQIPGVGNVRCAKPIWSIERGIWIWKKIKRKKNHQTHFLIIFSDIYTSKIRMTLFQLKCTECRGAEYT